MPYTDVAKHIMLDALCRATNPVTSILFASLHTAFPDPGGASEVSGGAPAYARKSITFNAASGGNSDSSNTPVFDVPGSTTVEWVGYWDVDTGSPDEFLAYSPIGSGGIIFDFDVDVAGDTIEAIAHGLSNDENIVFIDGTPPAPLVEGTVYWVVTSTADDFGVSATQGGASINLTDQGDASIECHKIVTETFGGQGTFTLTDADLDLNA